MHVNVIVWFLSFTCIMDKSASLILAMEKGNLNLVGKVCYNSGVIKKWVLRSTNIRNTEEAV